MTLTEMNPQTAVVAQPLQPHQLHDDITLAADLFTLCHLGVARLDRDAWRLHIDGLVEHPIILAWSDLARHERVELECIHQCQGSPMDPQTPTRRIANVRWTGVRLVDLLAQTGVKPGAKYVWSSGADWGNLGPARCDAYLKDMPIERLAPDILVAFELNGAPLSAEHGFPARLVIPGYYGTNSVKWLNRITLADQRPGGLFTTRFYNDPVLGADGKSTGQTRPVWAIAPESVIVEPAPGASVSVGDICEVWGRAWGERAVTRVAFSSDGGQHWNDVPVQPRDGARWQRFSFPWRAPRPGRYTLMSRAWDETGEVQPMSGWRNAVHQVEVLTV